MKELLEKFESKEPELVYEWNDPETGARGWLVINSLRGGAAGGGTRMRKGLNKHEVISLAKTMEIKFSCCGPLIGGAKSGIDFDPADPRKNIVLRKWFERVIPLLKSYYGTGGDMNVDEVKEVIPITEEMGLHHPQEGVLEGFYKPDEKSKVLKIKQLQQGVSKVVRNSDLTPSVDRKLLVADLITGYGVAESVRHYYDIYPKESLSGKKVLIQGWGNVASAAAWYLTREGAVVTGILDRQNGMIDRSGMNSERVRQLFLDKSHNELNSPDMIAYSEANKSFWNTEADVFIPAAASRLVSREHLDALKKAGVQVISCGANVPFADDKIFFGDISCYADEQFTVIPDFLANSGMARTFAYLMQEDIDLSDEAIFEDVSRVIREGIREVHSRNPDDRMRFSSRAMEMAIEKTM